MGARGSARGRAVVGMAVVAALGLVPGSVAGAAGATGASGAAGATSPGSSPTDTPFVDHVVVVGLAGLRWSDVAWATTPELAALAARGSVGTLSVRSAPSVTCPAEGWLTLGSGTYAATRDPAEIVPAEGCGARPLPPVEVDGARSARVLALPGMVELNQELRFGAEPGWLAQQLECVTAVGEGAALAAARADGAVTSYAAALSADPGGLLTRCPATLVDAGMLPGDGSRGAALERFDHLLDRVLAGLPPRTVLMVLGVAETDARQPRLHTAVVAGPGFGFGYLDSKSTRRIPYVQLADIAPTVLEMLGVRYQDTVAGRVLVGGSGDRPQDLAATRRALADTDVQAVEQRRVLAPFFGGLTVMVMLVAGAAVWTLSFRRSPCRGEPADPGQRPARLVNALRVSSIGLSGVPAALFLANLLPWWRAPSTVLAVVAAASLWTGAILVVALLGARLVEPGARRVRAQVGIVATITLAVFVADALSGSGLQINSLLGYNPLVAGRFTGFGNIAFAVLGAAAVIVASLAAHGKARARALGSLMAVALPVLALDGWPAWGADFGGVLTLVPTFVVLALLVTDTRITGRRLVGAGLAGAGLVGAIGWLDYLRPAAARSHFGRFIASLGRSGEEGYRALEIIERKLLASWELLLMGPHTIAAVGLTVGLVLLVFRPPRLLRQAYRVHGPLQPMLYGTVALALMGFATNDSGIAIPAVIVLVTGPATVALCTAEPEEAALG